MNGRIYTGIFEEVAVTAIQDFFELIGPADSALLIHEWGIYQSSDAGDAASEMLQILCHRGTATGSGGTSETPVPKNVGDAAFGGTMEVNNTSQSAEGAHIGGTYTFNIMAGIQQIYTPETRPVISPSGLFIIESQIAPADSLTMSGYLTFEEIGG